MANKPEDQNKQKEQVTTEEVPTPTPGRIVNFFPDKMDSLSGTSKSWPAIITEVEDAFITLTVFGKYGAAARQNVPHKSGKKKKSEDGHWEWPERN
jgi:hypothetical protein